MVRHQPRCLASDATPNHAETTAPDILIVKPINARPFALVRAKQIEVIFQEEAGAITDRPRARLKRRRVSSGVKFPASVRF